VLTAGDDRILKVYNLDDASLRWALPGHKTPITSIYANSKQGGAAITASEDGEVILWDVYLGARVYNLTGLNAPILALQDCANYTAASSIHSVICIWDKSNGRLLHTIQKASESHCGPLAVIAESLLISAGRETLNLWDLASGELIHSVVLPVTNNLEGISKLSVVNNGVILATVGADIHAVVFPKLLGRKYE